MLVSNQVRLFILFPFLPLSLPLHGFHTHYQFSAPRGELLEPPPSSHPILTDGFQICPAFIAMVLEQTFSGKEHENRYIHLREFEQLCSCLNIFGMNHETLNGSYFCSLFLRGQNNGTLIPLGV